MNSVIGCGQLEESAMETKPTEEEQLVLPLLFDFMPRMLNRRLPAGCEHVAKSYDHGQIIDGLARVCGPNCGEAWAKDRGRILAGNFTVVTETGGAHVSYATEDPEVLKRQYRFPNGKNHK